MEGITESLKPLLGKWKITECKTQHVSYPPWEKATDHINDWSPLEVKDVENSRSNLLLFGIGKENITEKNLSNIEIEFTETYRAKLTYHFIIYLNGTVLKQIFWEVSEEKDYCDLSIVMGEVYNYARCIIENLDQERLSLLERMDNTESDTYFSKFILERTL